MTDQQARDALFWHKDGMDYGWVMPSAPRWKRLPVIRHIRSIWLGAKVKRQADFYLSIGLLQSGYDQWVLWGIAHGMETDPSAPDLANGGADT